MTGLIRRRRICTDMWQSGGSHNNELSKCHKRPAFLPVNHFGRQPRICNRHAFHSFPLMIAQPHVSSPCSHVEAQVSRTNSRLAQSHVSLPPRLLAIATVQVPDLCFVVISCLMLNALSLRSANTMLGCLSYSPLPGHDRLIFYDGQICHCETIYTMHEKVMGWPKACLTLVLPVSWLSLLSFPFHRLSLSVLGLYTVSPLSAPSILFAASLS
jgi:hypothetical protein